MAEECEALLGSLHDETLRRVALLKLEGYTNAEIAKQLACAVSSIERKLARIRKAWMARPHDR
jgi:DNA-directed RNA polymerase specialized sigma24 family protein